MKRIQPFDALDAATEAALRESIERFGVLVPIVVDQHGRVLDGHHRKRIAESLGVKFRADVQPVKDDKEALAVARTLNAVRRHLPAKQRREIVAALRKEGHSLRAIGKALKVSQETVRKDAAGVNQLTPETLYACDCGECFSRPVYHCPHCDHHWLEKGECRNCHKSMAGARRARSEREDRVTGIDGKSYPSTRPPPNGKAEALLEGMKPGDRKRVEQILQETLAPPRAAAKIVARWDAATEEQKQRIWKGYTDAQDKREKSIALTTLADTVPEPDMRVIWSKATAVEARKQARRYPGDEMNAEFEKLADECDKLAEQTRAHHERFIQSKKEVIHEA